MAVIDDELPWPAAAGPLLGRYEPLGVIGRGGMGVVSRGRDRRTGEIVAIKRIRDADERAEREALAAARLDHPAIARLIDAERTGDGWVLVSEYVEGADLRAVLRAGELEDRDVARFAGAIVRALDHAHAHGIVHRDVKPANILCPADPRRAGAWAKLTDFGVAALHGAETLTAAGDVVGTMAYMAPEQARGHRAGPPADVFALAIVVYEALAGVNPRRGSTPAETAARATAPMPPLARLRPDLPGPICDAIDDCLLVEPEERGDLALLDDAMRRLAALGDPHRRGEATAPTRLGRRAGATRVRQAAAPPPPHARPVAPHAAAPHAAAATAFHAPEPPPHRPGAAAHDHHAPAPLPAHGADGHPPPYRHDVGTHGQPPRPLPGGLPRLPSRLAAAAGAGAACAVIADAAAMPPAFAAAGLIALLLPRLTWIALAVTAAALLARRNETAAALAAIALVTPLGLLPGRGVLWPAPGLAAGLAVIGLPAAWPGIAALAPRPSVRVALALQGALVAAAAATALELPLLRVPPGDFAVVLTQFVAPLAGIWAASALLLGLLVRGQLPALDVLAAGAWTAATGAALAAAGLADPEPALWGGPAVAAAVIVVVRMGIRERSRPAGDGAVAR